MIRILILIIILTLFYGNVSLDIINITGTNYFLGQGISIPTESTTKHVGRMFRTSFR